MNPDNNERIRFAAQLISKAEHLVLFTGAGISTPSGIPDFRSAGTGLWQKQDPMKVASATAFKYQSEEFFTWLRPLLRSSLAANPNPAHQIIARFEKAGLIKAVITQNIDGLHQLAGSINVIELHGTMRSFHCSACHKLEKNADQLIAKILAGVLPCCIYCGALMKPDITLYKERLPEKAWKMASQQVRWADVVLVAGSSLEVTPAASLPYDAVLNGSRLVVVNYAPTYLDPRADIVLHLDVAQALPEIFSFCKS